MAPVEASWAIVRSTRKLCACVRTVPISSDCRGWMSCAGRLADSLFCSYIFFFFLGNFRWIGLMMYTLLSNHLTRFLISWTLKGLKRTNWNYSAAYTLHIWLSCHHPENLSIHSFPLQRPMLPQRMVPALSECCQQGGRDRKLQSVDQHPKRRTVKPHRASLA